MLGRLVLLLCLLSACVRRGGVDRYGAEHATVVAAAACCVSGRGRGLLSDLRLTTVVAAGVGRIATSDVNADWLLLAL
jgi:hypothetical protein